jgi:hypothetical protein
MTVISLEIASKKEAYLNTIKELRLKSFNEDRPFLILSESLPDGQVYQEFKDGHIELQEVHSEGSNYSFKALKKLTASEAEKVRKEYGLF